MTQWKIGHPTVENKAQNSDYNSANMFNDFSKSRAQKGREYSHWIDPGVGIHFKVVIPESCRTKV